MKGFPSKEKDFIKLITIPLQRFSFQIIKETMLNMIRHYTILLLIKKIYYITNNTSNITKNIYCVTTLQSYANRIAKKKN